MIPLSLWTLLVGIHQTNAVGALVVAGDGNIDVMTRMLASLPSVMGCWSALLSDTTMTRGSRKAAWI